MPGWFTAGKIDEDTFALSEYRHWEETRSVRTVRSLPVRRAFPGHHRLDIPVSLIDEIDCGFEKLRRGGLLKRGNGVFDFGRFQIRL